MQNEIAHGFKNEECARRLVQKEGEITNLKMCSGSTVCSEASTGEGLGSGIFARPLPPSSRWSGTFIPRNMVFKGWVTDYSKSGLQRITGDEVTKFLNDLERMVPQRAQKRIDWDHIRKEQGTWPRKIMVSMWVQALNESRIQLPVRLNGRLGLKSDLRGGR